MANEGGYIYGQDEDKNAVQSRDKVIGKVDMPEGDMQVSQDNCNVTESTEEYSDRVKDWGCED